MSTLTSSTGAQYRLFRVASAMVSVVLMVAGVLLPSVAFATDSTTGWQAGNGRWQGVGPGQILNEFYSFGDNATYRQKWLGALDPSVVIPGRAGSAYTGEVWCVEGGADLSYSATGYTTTTETSTTAASRAGYALWLSERRGSMPAVRGYGAVNWGAPAAHAGVQHFLYRWAFPTLGQNTTGTNYANRIWSHAEFTGETASDVLADLVGSVTSTPHNTAADLEWRGTGGGVGVLDGIGVKDAWGNYIAGLPYTVTITGPATFDATGTATVTGTTTASLIDNVHAWTATGDMNTVHFRIVYPNADVNGVVRYSHPTYQDLVFPNYQDLEDIADPFAGGPFQPGGVSHVTTTLTQVGDTLTDTFTTDALTGEWLHDQTPPFAAIPATWDVDVYRMNGTTVPAPSPTVPADATWVASTQVTGTGGDGEVLTATLGTATTPGVYVFVWSFHVANQPTELQEWFEGDWSDQFAAVNETTITPWPGHVTTQLAATWQDNQLVVEDTVTAGGFPAGHGSWAGDSVFSPDVSTITHTLYLFAPGVEVTDVNLPSATIIGTPVTSATTDPTVVVGGVAAGWVVELDGNNNPTPGTYVVVSTFVGDARVASFTTSVTDVLEQVTIVPEPVGLTTVAHSSDPVLYTGGVSDVWDTATVTGAVPVGSTLEFRLYGWSTTTPTCTPDTLLATMPATTPFAGAGVYESEHTELTIPAVNHLSFVATIRTPDGATLMEDTCGATTETLPVKVMGGGGAGLANTGVSDTTTQLLWTSTITVLAGAALLLVGVLRRRNPNHTVTV